MAFPTKTKLPIAVTNRTEIDLSCQHVTTTDFLNFGVAKAIELVPKQSINIQHISFARFEAMPVPTFGRGVIKNRAYFVPYRTIWSAWNDFINDVPHIYDGGVLANINQVPVINTADISAVFMDDKFAIEVQPDDAYDFEFVRYDNNGTSVVPLGKWYGKFTYLGRNAYKLLRSLGYAVDFTNRNHFVSALPLLSVCRVYNDFYYPSAYANDDTSAWIQSFFTNNNDLLTDDVIFNDSDLKRLLPVLVKVSYESDYFTSAWDNPNAPNSGLSSSFVIDDINDEDAEHQIDYLENSHIAGPQIINPAEGSITKLSQYALNALRSLSDYLKRHQIAGSRTIDRYLARWGVKLPSEKLNRSMFVGEFVQELQFGDILATADTDGAQLGDFAGRGISKGSGEFDFTTDEFGMLIIVSLVVPKTQYYQGENRHCSHLSKLDFFTPEFDNLGTQAIASSELYVPVGGGIPNGYRNFVFGFTPRYADYKVPYSQITGDYVCKSMNVGKDAWTLFRDVEPFVEQEGIDFSHSIDFVEANDNHQYNRIFYNTDSNADHINVIHNFIIKSSFPGKSLFDTYEFENEDKAQKVAVDINGMTHN